MSRADVTSVPRTSPAQPERRTGGRRRSRSSWSSWMLSWSTSRCRRSSPTWRSRPRTSLGRERLHDRSSAGFLLLGGRAADLFGRRRLFIGASLLFAARVARRRPGAVRGHADLRPWPAGPRRRAGSPAALSIIPRPSPQGPEPQPRDRALGRDRRRRRRVRPAPRRRVGRGAGLALGPPINVPIGAAVIALAPRIVLESRSGVGRRAVTTARAR